VRIFAAAAGADVVRLQAGGPGLLQPDGHGLHVQIRAGGRDAHRLRAGPAHARAAGDARHHHLLPAAAAVSDDAEAGTGAAGAGVAHVLRRQGMHQLYPVQIRVQMLVWLPRGHAAGHAGPAAICDHEPLHHLRP
jgi:hypothetical protein